MSLSPRGYIVVGADDRGAPSGMFSPEAASDFDEQKIRSKVVAVLGEPIDLSAALHCIESNNFLLIGIGPNRDGMRIMARDGGYDNKVCQHIQRLLEVAASKGRGQGRPSRASEGRRRCVDWPH